MGLLTTRYSLLDGIREGSSESWSNFVRVYAPPLKRYLMRLGAQDAEADEVVQETLIKVFKKLPPIGPGSSRSFGAWLLRVAKTGLLERYRRNKVAGRGVGDAGLSGVVQIDREEEREFVADAARRALAAVTALEPPRTREICREVLVEGRKVAEVARDRGMTENACRLIVFRGLRKLRETLGESID